MFFAEYSEGYTEWDIPKGSPDCDFEVVSSGSAIVDYVCNKVNRPNGRKDYQIIFISEGRGHFKFGNNDYEIVPAGKAVIYRPDEPQFYYYDIGDVPHVSWVHFWGDQVNDLFEELNIGNNHIFSVEDGLTVLNIILRIQNELSAKNRGYKYSCISHLISMLFLIKNTEELSKKVSVSGTNNSTRYLVENVCHRIHEELSVNKSNAEYANECNLSTSHFLSVFRHFTGMSPHRYKLNLRISTAKRILESSDYKIKDVARSVGFEDSLYFCKIFKKETGLTPSEYREAYSN